MIFKNSFILLLLPGSALGNEYRSTQLRTTLPSYTPVRLSYQSLSVDSSSPPLGDHARKSYPLLDSLSDSGLVSITNIPGFAVLKNDVMRHLQECLDDQEKGSGNVLDHAYDDGTVRRTMATVTVPGPGGAQALFKDTEWAQNVPSCDNLRQLSNTFRKLVQDVTNTFAHRLTTELGHSIRSPLMKTRHDEYTFPHLEDVVREGHHLEHFHSYQKRRQEMNLNISSMVSEYEYDPELATIELHTDQGFFIAFTPGMLLSKDDSSLSLSSGFQIELSNGKRHVVAFDKSDDLIFMMGDGVNQYINPHLYITGDSNSPKPLRATPHALHLPSYGDNVSRVWYGRMILPPPGAFSFQHSMTYGDIRSRLMKESSLSADSVSLRGIGCSSLSLKARQLEDVTCAPNSTWCWHRCMPWSDYGISEEICTSRQLGLQCINPRGEFYSDPTKHGDYYIACSNSTQPITPFNLLPNYPQNPKVCNASQWAIFRNQSKDGTTKYKHSFDLSVGNTTAAYFTWSVLPDNKTIQGRLAFNGLFGFIAIGFRNTDPNAYLNGMLGGKVLMALAGGNYSAQTGLNMSLPGTVHEYQIDSSQTTFRLWNKPLSDNLLNKSAAIEANDCFTAITFQTEAIAGKPFNVSGVDSLIWAANGQDTFVAYHGSNRGRFAVEWKTGAASWGNTLNSSKTSSCTRVSVGTTVLGCIIMSALVIFSY